MESSIVEFLERQLACELLLTSVRDGVARVYINVYVDACSHIV